MTKYLVQGNLANLLIQAKWAEIQGQKYMSIATKMGLVPVHDCIAFNTQKQLWEFLERCWLEDRLTDLSGIMQRANQLRIARGEQPFRRKI